MHKDNENTCKQVAGTQAGADPLGLSKCPFSQIEEKGCSKPPFIAQNKITSNSLVEYSETVRWQSRKATPEGGNKKGKKITDDSRASGTVTRKVNKRINDSVKALSSRLRIMAHRGKAERDRPTVITLTLPADQGNVSDMEIKEYPLRYFMQWLQNVCGVVYGLWKAEKQENGNIHFHILCDAYIPYQRIRDQWNKYLKPLGFIDAFEKKHGHTDPNSTDIHIAKKAKNVEGYVGKYVAKSDSNGKIEGRVWGSTDALKKLKNYNSPETNEVSDLKEELKANPKFYKAYGDYYTEIKGDVFGYIFTHKDRFPDLYENLMRLNTNYQPLFFKEMEPVEEKSVIPI